MLAAKNDALRIFRQQMQRPRGRDGFSASSIVPGCPVGYYDSSRPFYALSEIGQLNGVPGSRIQSTASSELYYGARDWVEWCGISGSGYSAGWSEVPDSFTQTTTWYVEGWRADTAGMSADGPYIGVSVDGQSRTDVHHCDSQPYCLYTFTDVVFANGSGLGVARHAVTGSFQERGYWGSVGATAEERF
jgi:hypothetical protein